MLWRAYWLVRGDLSELAYTIWWDRAIPAPNVPRDEPELDDDERRITELYPYVLLAEDVVRWRERRVVAGKEETFDVSRRVLDPAKLEAVLRMVTGSADLDLLDLVLAMWWVDQRGEAAVAGCREYVEAEGPRVAEQRAAVDLA